MTKVSCAAIVGLVLGLIAIQRPAGAAVYPLDLSPPANQAANLGTQIYPGDHAPGLSPLNESTKPASTASGGKMSGGITYDDATNVISFDFGYGSAHGFSDLNSDWNGGVHIHGNGLNTAQFPNNNTNAGVIYDLAASHTASGARSGRVTGTRTISDLHEGWLFNNQLYINVHTLALAPGEIRGQLVVVPEPGALALLGAAGAVTIVRRRRAN